MIVTEYFNVNICIALYFIDSYHSRRRSTTCKLVKLTIALGRTQTSFPLEKHGF